MAADPCVVPGGCRRGTLDEHVNLEVFVTDIREFRLSLQPGQLGNPAGRLPGLPHCQCSDVVEVGAAAEHD